MPKATFIELGIITAVNRFYDGVYITDTNFMSETGSRIGRRGVDGILFVRKTSRKNGRLSGEGRVPSSTFIPPLLINQSINVSLFNPCIVRTE